VRRRDEGVALRVERQIENRARRHSDAELLEALPGARGAEDADVSGSLVRTAFLHLELRRFGLSVAETPYEGGLKKSIKALTCACRISHPDTPSNSG